MNMQALCVSAQIGKASQIIRLGLKISFAANAAQPDSAPLEQFMPFLCVCVYVCAHVGASTFACAVFVLQALCGR